MENKIIDDEKDYNISFFKPTTEMSKINRNLILVLVSIWAVAIFGFQILLKVVEKPRPEKAFTQYELVWNNIKTSTASVEEKQIYIKSALSVLGKITIKPADRLILNSSVSKLTIGLLPEADQLSFINKIEEFKKLEFSNPTYSDSKKEIGDIAAEFIGVPPYSLEAKLIPLELAAAQTKDIDFINIETVMSKYLIHNQSFLTDYVLLGFPFHYFYTAVFLLILFVGICLYYCIAIDIRTKKLGIIEDEY